MSLVVHLDGTPIPPEEIEGENGVSVTITAEDDDGETLVKKATGELTFYGNAWATIKAQLIDPPDGKLREVPVVFFDSCRTPYVEVFRGVIRGDTISWCSGECSVKAHAVEKTDDTTAMDCLKSTMIHDNHAGFQSQNHPRMTYCDERRPLSTHHAILGFGTLLVLMIDILTPIVAIFSFIVFVINTIIDAINAIPGIDIDNIDFDGDDSTNTLEEWQNMRDRLVLEVIGCGRTHPSPLVRAYIGNVCAKCGLTFQSETLNNAGSDYYNTVLFSAPNEKGTRDPGTLWISQNEHNATGHTFLKALGAVFHGRHRVLDQVLYFDREDKLPGGGTWVDPQTLKAQGRLVGNVCFKWREDSPPALAHVQFSADALDIVGNEAKELYLAVVEWNDPLNGVQKGDQLIQFPFGMVRCRRDGEGSDILDSWRILPEFVDQINAHGDAIMLERGVAALPKLLVWDGASIANGRVRRFNIPGYVKTFAENYNYPYHVTEFGTTPNTGYEPDEAGLALYGRFHAYRNPKVLSDRGLSWDFTFEKYTAEELMSVNPLAPIPLPDGLPSGRTMAITINLDKRTILVAGKV